MVTVSLTWLTDASTRSHLSELPAGADMQADAVALIHSTAGCSGMTRCSMTTERRQLNYTSCLSVSRADWLASSVALALQ
jgi:hypothetical protein